MRRGWVRRFHRQTCLQRQEDVPADERPALELAVKGCPVIRSLNPEIEVEILFVDGTYTQTKAKLAPECIAGREFLYEDC
jgi:hypothetical protein